MFMYLNRFFCASEHFENSSCEIITCPHQYIYIQWWQKEFGPPY